MPVDCRDYVARLKTDRLFIYLCCVLLLVCFFTYIVIVQIIHLTRLRTVAVCFALLLRVIIYFIGLYLYDTELAVPA